MNVAEFHNKHQGEEVFILGNAKNLTDHAELLERVPFKIGVNSSNAHIHADYHVLTDSAAGFRFVKHEHKPKFVFYTPGGIQAEVDPGCERVFLNPKVNSYVAWSNDLSKYVQVCKATMWVALQLAKYMGFRYAYLMGFELSGARIEGHVHDLANFLDENASLQLQLMGYLRGLIDGGGVTDFFPFMTSITSKCKSFPFIHLEHRDVQRNFLYKAKPPDINVTWDY